ncbi:MAG TPA: glycoside hydrolase family 2, partial [Coriobacteriia bacterium]|nr:glycoside hydrolase family 2 [Coriobacteriia bacterium]
MLDFKRVFTSAPKKPENVELRPLLTPWGERLAEDDKRESQHPHPQFARERFVLLDGRWEYCFVAVDDAVTAWRTAEPPIDFEGPIRVPFSPEAPLSGVNRQLKPDELLWYKTTFRLSSDLNVFTTTDRCLLHFEAVDYACSCYCNGRSVGEHVGGYLPFFFDITDVLVDGENELTLCVYDPGDTGVQLRGKQRLERGGIWYTAQSGIWQSVWLEPVPERHITSLEIETHPDTGELVLNLTVSHGPSDGTGQHGPIT